MANGASFSRQFHEVAAVAVGGHAQAEEVGESRRHGQYSANATGRAEEAAQGGAEPSGRSASLEHAPRRSQGLRYAVAPSRRRMGGDPARRHDLQRHQDLSLDGGRSRLAPRPHPDVNDRAGDYMPPASICSTLEHNQPITWDHLLRQTSDWQGTLWGKPDWADRPEGQRPADWPNRPLREPGTHFKYNDVRVNVLALAALQVLAPAAAGGAARGGMDPIGASNTWRWHGYENSWVDHRRPAHAVGGRRRPLGRRHVHQHLRHGALRLSLPAATASGRTAQLVSEKWIAMARTPGPANANYGFANWYLNTERRARSPRRRRRRCTSSATATTSSTSTGRTISWL